MSNKTLMQYFHWHLPVDGKHWIRTAEDAAHLADLGITDVWLPPAYKGQAGMMDEGYGVYDLYDLGEFYQKGSIPTKYGTKDEYLAAIQALHAHNIQVLGDIVLNHRMGEDFCEPTTGKKMNPENRFEILVKNKKLIVHTGFTFPGRQGKYSRFQWNKDHFNGGDLDEKNHLKGVFKFDGHTWSLEVDDEMGNFDYLMGVNVDFSRKAVRDELINWGKWYMEFTGIDGVRLDAVKHIHRSYFTQWLRALREHFGRDFFAVGEYWNGDVNKLTDYLDKSGRNMSLFDVPLHYHFHQAGEDGSSYDLTTIFNDTLVARDPEHAVTFVDNHDTHPDQPLKSWVAAWFKPLAYALILLRRDGTPCAFHGDMYGVDFDGSKPVSELEELLRLRQKYATGDQTDYFDFRNVIGWTRESGMGVVLSNGDDGHKDMKLGQPGQIFVDALGNRPEEVKINEDGWGRFWVKSRSVSVWVPKK